MFKILQQSVSVSFLAVILLTGCTIGPDYERNAPALPVTYQNGSANESIATLTWWEFFGDDKLKLYLEEALNNNHNIRAAVARSEAAEALYGVTKAELFPHIDIGGSGQRIGPSSYSPILPGVNFNDYSLFAKLGYELDVWGRVRRATEAERAQFLATDYARHAVRISSLSQLSVVYFRALGTRERLDIARRTSDQRKASVKKIKSRKISEASEKLDIHQAKVEAAIVGSDVLALERASRQVENLFRVLLGRSGGPVELGQTLAEQLNLPGIPEGFPADLLERRPDVLAAEEQVKSQMARIGVARAEQLPTFSLSGLIGLQSESSADIFKHGDSLTWSVGGQFLGPLIDFGKSESKIKFTEAMYREALQNYQQTVLEAVREVEDAHIAVVTYDQEFKLRSEQVEAAGKSLDFATKRYLEVGGSYLEVLEAERSLFSAEISKSQARENYLIAIIQLYRALGGGWSLK